MADFVTGVGTGLQQTRIRVEISLGTQLWPRLRGDLAEEPIEIAVPYYWEFWQ
jgi:hypothetical protein